MPKYLNADGVRYLCEQLCTAFKSVFAMKSSAISMIERNGTTFTATKADGNTFTFDQQDSTVEKSSTTPLEDGVAAVGSENKYAAGNHVHPHDSTKVDKVDGKGLSSNDYTSEEKSKLGSLPTSADLTSSLGNKVDKVAGKGLSTNDYSTEEKEKLAALPNNSTLESSYVKKAGDETIAGNKTFSNNVSANAFTGNGSGLTDLNGSSISSGTVAAARIGSLPASKVTSGTFDAARIPSLDASKIGTGQLSAARLPSLYGVQNPVVEKNLSGAILTFTDGIGSDVSKMIVNIDAVQEGSGDPSSSNIRPISGYTGAKIYKTKKNLFDLTVYNGGKYNPTVGTQYTLSVAPAAKQFTDNQDGTFSVTSSATWTYYTLLFRQIPGVRYHRHIKIKYTTNIKFTVAMLDKDFKVLSVSNYAPSADYTFDHLSSAQSVVMYYAFTLTNSGTASSTLTIQEPQIEFISDDYTYEPYAGSVSDISWQTEVGTIYGGNLNVNTGVLTVTHGQIASYNGETLSGVWISDRDVYGEETTPTTGAQVVYALDTPQTYQLTAMQISTLLGQNFLWADTGDISIRYSADSSIAMQNADISETLNATPRASKSYSVGDYISVGNMLCKATSAIVPEDEIKLGINVNLVNLGDVLNAILSEMEE